MDKKFYGKKISVIPIDKDSFKLEIYAPSSKISKILHLITQSKGETVFSESYDYGEKISTKWFELKIEKLQDVQSDEYYFSYVPNERMNVFVRMGLYASMTSRGGSIMKVTFEDTVPKRAQEVLMALAEAYKNDELERGKKKEEGTVEFIDSQLRDFSKVLSKSANQLKTFKQAESVVDLQSSASEASLKLKEVKEQLKGIELEKRILDNLLDFMKNNDDLEAVSISSDSLSNVAIYENIQKYHELSKLKRDLLVGVTEFHPDVVSLNEEMRLLKENLKYVIVSTVKNLQHKTKLLKESMREYEKTLYAIPQKAGTLANLNRSYTINEGIYTFLLKKRIETAIVNSSRTSNVRVMETPIVPQSPFKPNRKFMILIGIIVGFLVGTILAFVFYFRDYTIKDKEEVEAITTLPFFGLIPKVIKGKYTIAYEEAFRTLRTNLEFIKVDKNSKVILIASAISGEGKSTTIKNLANMLVKLNRKTIVLDFDLRRPSIHKYFSGIQNELGLSVLLSGQNSLQECIQKTDEGVNVITAGPIPPNPSELIMSDASKLLLQTLSNSYDYILIDSPPYSVVTDASILMAEADITLFSIMQEHTKRDTVKELNALVDRHNIKSAGIVYNGLKLSKLDKHGYGYFN